MGVTYQSLEDLSDAGATSGQQGIVVLENSIVL
jgi:hypothetical protein